VQGHWEHPARPAPPGLPRCKGRKRIQRTGSRAVHRAARKIRTGRQAAARYQHEDHDGTS